jgi:hypothetical protein
MVRLVEDLHAAPNFLNPKHGIRLQDFRGTGFIPNSRFCPDFVSYGRRVAPAVDTVPKCPGGALPCLHLIQVRSVALGSHVIAVYESQRSGVDAVAQSSTIGRSVGKYVT